MRIVYLHVICDHGFDAFDIRSLQNDEARCAGCYARQSWRCFGWARVTRSWRLDPRSERWANQVPRATDDGMASPSGDINGWEDPSF